MAQASLAGGAVCGNGSFSFVSKFEPLEVETGNEAHSPAEPRKRSTNPDTLLLTGRAAHDSTPFLPAPLSPQRHDLAVQIMGGVDAADCAAA